MNARATEIKEREAGASEEEEAAAQEEDEDEEAATDAEVALELSSLKAKQRELEEAINEALAAEVEEADLVEAYELLADLKRRQVMLGGVVEEEEAAAVEATSVLMRLPADVKAGAVLSATLPDGTRLTFTAPEDAYPGMLVDANTGMEVEGVVMPTRKEPEEEVVEEEVVEEEVEEAEAAAAAVEGGEGGEQRPGHGEGRPDAPLRIMAPSPVSTPLLTAEYGFFDSLKAAFENEDMSEQDQRVGRRISFVRVTMTSRGLLSSCRRLERGSKRRGTSGPCLRRSREESRSAPRRVWAATSAYSAQRRWYRSLTMCYSRRILQWRRRRVRCWGRS